MSQFVWFDGGQWQCVATENGSDREYAAYCENLGDASRNNNVKFVIIDDEFASLDWFEKHEPQAFGDLLDDEALTPPPTSAQEFVEAIRKAYGWNLLTRSMWQATATPEQLEAEQEESNRFMELEEAGEFWRK